MYQSFFEARLLVYQQSLSRSLVSASALPSQKTSQRYSDMGSKHHMLLGVAVPELAGQLMATAY